MKNDENRKMVPTIDQTVDFIKTVHAGQTDKGGQPYYLHPIRVMRHAETLMALFPITVLPQTTREAVRRACLLHDTVEDTRHLSPAQRVTAERLRAMDHDDETVTIVGLLTRDEGPDRPSYAAWIDQLVASGNLGAMIAKYADNMDNADPVRIAQLPEEERSIARRYAKSMAKMRAAVLAATGVALP